MAKRIQPCKYRICGERNIVKLYIFYVSVFTPLFGEAKPNIFSSISKRWIAMGP